MRAIIVRKKFWGLQMLTWVWLARAKHELTKPKSTFRPQNFLSGLRAPHEQSFPFPTGAVVLPGQLSPWGSFPPGAVVYLGSCHLGSCRQGHRPPGQMSSHLSGGQRPLVGTERLPALRRVHRKGFIDFQNSSLKIFIDFCSIKIK